MRIVLSWLTLPLLIAAAPAAAQDEEKEIAHRECDHYLEDLGNGMSCSIVFCRSWYQDGTYEESTERLCDPVPSSIRALQSWSQAAEAAAGDLYQPGTGR